jgi:hypothetical protein
MKWTIITRDGSTKVYEITGFNTLCTPYDKLFRREGERATHILSLSDGGHNSDVMRARLVEEIPAPTNQMKEQR